MHEIELKFQVPAARLAGLRRAVATSSAVRTRLQALYVDTADGRLAGAQMALRLRKEGRHWVQTLKGRGDGLMQRLEHEVRLPPARGTPAIDPGRHAGTPAGERLAALLADGAPLQVVYRTEIRRTHRRLRHAGAVIEVALDEGVIVAGDASVPVREVEFELVTGTPGALIALVSRWAPRHGLRLDPRTKSERGQRLARGEERAPPRKAAGVTLDPAMTAGQAFAAVVLSTVEQVLANAAEVAESSPDPGHLHQLRVGLRRLRSALVLLGGWSADPTRAEALEARLREPFVRLGAARDDDVLAATLLPALAAAGGPPLTLAGTASATPPAVVAGEPAFGVLLLEAVALALGASETAAAAPKAAPPLRDAAAEVLRAAAKRALKGHAAFAEAPAEVQHRTRKRLKRLRYGAEFLQSLFPGRRTSLHLAALREALEAIGEYTDLLVAEDRLRALAADQPAAWFGLGWLAARRPLMLGAAADALERLAETRRPWR